MNRTSRIAVFGAAAIVALAGTYAIAQSNTSKRAGNNAAGQPEMQFPFTPEEMQAMEAASTTGPMHSLLAKSVGTWETKSKMWMAPNTPPMETVGKATYSTMMDGRFTKAEMSGDIPGMGPFNGMGIYGYNNVAERFEASWICNCGTGIMNGTGTLSSDGKTITWEYTSYCPIRQGPCKMREVETITGPNTKTLVVYGSDYKTGKEFKMMDMEFTRTSRTNAAAR